MLRVTHRGKSAEYWAGVRLLLCKYRSRGNVFIFRAGVVVVVAQGTMALERAACQ
jgi:hypothetical protein